MIQSNVIWTAKEACSAMNVKCESDWQATGVSIDSRTVQPGDLFVALIGDNGDGHDYVEKAFENGAVAAIVARKVDSENDKLILVDDTLKALEALGQAARKRSNAKIIAVTGSVGKTGTKELLQTAFSQFGQTHASVKSYNNHWGVPLSLARMHAGTDFAIFEVGMNHANEISPLSQMIQPDIAIITTVAPVHIENFDNGIDGVVEAKAEIFDGMKQSTIAILNRDNEHFFVLEGKAKKKNLEIYSFGESDNCHARLKSCLEAANGSRAEVDIMNDKVNYSLQIAGRHIIQNTLSVLLAIKLAGLDVKKAATALAKQEAVEGRGKREYLEIGENNNPVTLIDESYNASPTAMQAAFKVLALIDPGRGGRRIAVLGDMLELGKDSDKMHEELALPLKAAGVDLVYTCGKRMRNLYKELPANKRGHHAVDSKELAQIVPDVLIPGDVVMVKGSLGSKMSLVVEALRALPEKFKKATEG